MEKLNYPIDFTFNIATIANDFSAIDANGKEIAYVKQKLFKLKEDINVYNNSSKSEINYNIKADRWIDFSAVYSFFNKDNIAIGKVARKGWKSMWKARYEVMDTNGEPMFLIKEENGWVKVFDGLIGEIPILNFFTGYLFNPSYILTDKNENKLVRLKKQQSFFGRKFKLTKILDTELSNDPRVILGFMMMILLERRRG